MSGLVFFICLIALAGLLTFIALRANLLLFRFAGALPATAGTRANQAAWTGDMPAFFLDNSNL